MPGEGLFSHRWEGGRAHNARGSSGVDVELLVVGGSSPLGAVWSPLFQLQTKTLFYYVRNCAVAYGAK